MLDTFGTPPFFATYEGAALRNPHQHEITQFLLKLEAPGSDRTKINERLTMAEQSAASEYGENNLWGDLTAPSAAIQPPP